MIKMAHVGLRYDGGPEVLSDINLSIDSGSFHYLTGASGSGKTSLMKLLYMGLLPTRGDIDFFGDNVMQLSRKKRAAIRQNIGVIFQNFQLLSNLNLYDNLALPRRLKNLPKKKIDTAVNEMAEWIELKNYLHVRPPFLSGGQQQRVAIARAVITKPKLLLADEPTGSLDDTMGQKIMQLFESLNQSGTAILLATHNKNMITTFPHPQFNLRAGHLIS